MRSTNVTDTSSASPRQAEDADDVVIASSGDAERDDVQNAVTPVIDDSDESEEEADEESDEDSEDSEEEDEDEEEDDEEAAADGAAAEGAVASGKSGGRGAETLFQESEIAADYIEGLLDILDYDGDIDELVSAGRPMVEVVGGRLNALVGTRGATLEALQELARLAVFRQTGTPSRLLLDIGGYRAGRRKELGAVAKNAAEKVKEFGEPVRLEPMSAFERKCVHDVINALNGVESESEGVEPSRRIVVRASA
jgi:spoIIIJ-associated protein